jgi:hypothetical protein
VMLAHEQPRHRAKAAASVVVDRVVGLYLLFVVAAAAIFLTGFWNIPAPEMHYIARIALVLTAVGTLGIALMFLPGEAMERLTQMLGRLPRVGLALESLCDAVRMYRRMPRVLAVSSAMSVGVHCLFAASIYLIARGLLADQISLGSHYVIVPLSNATGVLPLLMGPFEFVLEFLYTHLPLAAGVAVPLGQGLVVALCYRLITVMIAAMGAYYYLGNRAEVTQAMHESQPSSSVPAPLGAVFSTTAHAGVNAE